MGVAGPVYQVIGRMFMEFDADCDVELYVKEVKQDEYIAGL